MGWQLQKHPSFPGVRGPVLVVVMDGVGLGRQDEGDAVWLARTPTLDRLAREAASTTLAAHGKAVGLPSDGDMGNSEVGHNALGAGRVFDQGAKRVNLAIESGEIFEGEVWREAVARCKAGGTLHLMGLLSDGNVHSHQDHLHAMLERAHEEGVERARVHALLDGRDVPATSALTYVDALEAKLRALRDAGRDYRVASGGGRMTTTMDRYEADWSMVQRGWDAHVRGVARAFPDLRTAIETLREETPGIGDQDLGSFTLAEEGAPVGPIVDGDVVLFFNFRGDRALEITRAFTEEPFDAFDRGPKPDVYYAGMMQYDGDLLLPEKFLVTPPDIDHTLGELLAAAGVSQWACSETQKYGHVTYFWNGNRSGKFDPALETYLEIGSDVLPFEQRPWMKAAEITDATLAALKSGQHRHLRINYANGDMVGHTGHLDATVMAVETVDLQLARLLPVIAKLEGAIIVTADHGNADQMFEIDKKSGAFKEREDGSPQARTSHSLNRVPCHVWVPGHDVTLRDEAAGLDAIAGTVLQLLGKQVPDDYVRGLLRET